MGILKKLFVRFRKPMYEDLQKQMHQAYIAGLKRKYADGMKVKFIPYRGKYNGD